MEAMTEKMSDVSNERFIIVALEIFIMMGASEYIRNIDSENATISNAIFQFQTIDVNSALSNRALVVQRERGESSTSIRHDSNYVK